MPSILSAALAILLLPEALCYGCRGFGGPGCGPNAIRRDPYLGGLVGGGGGYGGSLGQYGGYGGGYGANAGGYGGLAGGYPGLGGGGYPGLAGLDGGGAAGLGGYPGLGGGGYGGLGAGGLGGGFGGLGSLGGASGGYGGLADLGDPFAGMGGLRSRRRLSAPHPRAPRLPWMSPKARDEGTATDDAGEKTGKTEKTLISDKSEKITENKSEQTVTEDNEGKPKPKLVVPAASKKTEQGEKVSNIKDELESEKGAEEIDEGEIPPPPPTTEEEKEDGKETPDPEATSAELVVEEEVVAGAACPTPDTPDCWMYWVEAGEDGCSCIDADGVSKRLLA